MDTSILEKANRLNDQIKKLNDHKLKVENSINDSPGFAKINSQIPLVVQTVRNGSHDSFILNEKYLRLDEFFSMYLMRLQKEINQLELELKNL